jgi:O-antigen/teichoic acid export membrane protein
MVFLVVVIAIILIFIEADGWSVAPDLPQRAHPILGIIIFICIIINVSTLGFWNVAYQRWGRLSLHQ